MAVDGDLGHGVQLRGLCASAALVHQHLQIVHATEYTNVSCYCFVIQLPYSGLYGNTV